MWAPHDGQPEWSIRWTTERIPCPLECSRVRRRTSELVETDRQVSQDEGGQPVSRKETRLFLNCCVSTAKQAASVWMLLRCWYVVVVIHVLPVKRIPFAL